MNSVVFVRYEKCLIDFLFHPSLLCEHSFLDHFIRSISYTSIQDCQRSRKLRHAVWISVKYGQTTIPQYICIPSEDPDIYCIPHHHHHHRASHVASQKFWDAVIRYISKKLSECEYEQTQIAPKRQKGGIQIP